MASQKIEATRKVHKNHKFFAELFFKKATLFFSACSDIESELMRIFQQNPA
jgi:hypothetical protein